MKPLYSSADIRSWDENLINNRGVPAHTVMEVAGRECAKRIQDLFPISSICIFCGSGNNGGDGYVIARWLHLWGWTVSVVPVAPPKSPESQLNHTLLPDGVRATKVPVASDVALDCMLGTGQKGEPLGRYKEMIDWINKQSSTVVSVDVPSGRCPDEGSPFGASYLSPSVCLSIGGLKTGLFGEYYGQIIEEIDIGLHLVAAPKPSALLVEKSDVLQRFPIHPDNYSKWDKGHVAIFAKGGAAVLAAHAALIAGAGLVTILCSSDEQSNLQGLRPEIMLKSPQQLDQKRHNVLVLGPNIGFSQDSVDFVQNCWHNFPNAIVVDADALRIIAAEIPAPSAFPRVLTPHYYEAAALLNKQPEEITRYPYRSLSHLQKLGSSMLKGPYTKFGEHPHHVNPLVTSRLGIAGSGDILSGVIGAFLAQKMGPNDAMILSCYLHAFAGKNLERGDSASDLLNALRALFAKFEKLKLS